MKKFVPVLLLSMALKRRVPLMSCLNDSCTRDALRLTNFEHKRNLQ